MCYDYIYLSLPFTNNLTHYRSITCLLLFSYRDLDVNGSQLIIVGVASNDAGRYQCKVTLDTINIVLTTSVDVDILRESNLFVCVCIAYI